MDVLHLRVKDYMTLTLWVENPIICKTQRLTSMECTSEDTENVTIFLQNFLAILHKVKKDLNYMWKLRMIMADENGANKRAVGNVLGEDIRQRTVSCQWHFLRCVKKVLHRIDVQDCDNFMKLCNLIVKNAVTKNAYEEYHIKLEMICICNNVKSWIDFWHKRHFHLVSAFRGFFMPGVKLLALVDAAYKDISAQMWQDELYRATIENCTTERGWVCNQGPKNS